MWQRILTRFIVVIVLQCIEISNHYFIHLKLIYYASIIPQFKICYLYTHTHTHGHTHTEISLVAQMVKNPPAMRDWWAQSLGWEDPLEEGMATHSGILAGKIPQRGAWWATVHTVTNSRTWLNDWAQHTYIHTYSDVVGRVFFCYLLSLIGL